MTVKKKTKVKAVCVRLPEATITALDRVKSKTPMLSRSALINGAILAQIENKRKTYGTRKN